MAANFTAMTTPWDFDSCAQLCPKNSSCMYLQNHLLFIHFSLCMDYTNEKQLCSVKGIVEHFVAAGCSVIFIDMSVLLIFSSHSHVWYFFPKCWPIPVDLAPLKVHKLDMLIPHMTTHTWMWLSWLHLRHHYHLLIIHGTNSLHLWWKEVILNKRTKRTGTFFVYMTRTKSTDDATNESKTISPTFTLWVTNKRRSCLFSVSTEVCSLFI